MKSLVLIFMLVTHEHHLPPGLLSSLCYVESHHKVEAVNRQDGSGDSLGLCQIKLTTAAQMGFKGTAKDLMNPTTNAYYAGKFLRSQIKRYKSVQKGIVAYNAGHYDPEYKIYLTKVLKAVRERR